MGWGSIALVFTVLTACAHAAKPSPESVVEFFRKALIEPQAEYIQYSAAEYEKFGRLGCENAILNPCTASQYDDVLFAKSILIFNRDVDVLVMRGGKMTFPKCTTMCLIWTAETGKVAGGLFVKQPIDFSFKNGKTRVLISGFFDPERTKSVTERYGVWETASSTYCSGYLPTKDSVIDGWYLYGFAPTLSHEYWSAENQVQPLNLRDLMGAIDFIDTNVSSFKHLYVTEFCLVSNSGQQAHRMWITSGSGEISSLDVNGFSRYDMMIIAKANWKDHRWNTDMDAFVLNENAQPYPLGSVSSFSRAIPRSSGPGIELKEERGNFVGAKEVEFSHYWPILALVRHIWKDLQIDPQTIFGRTIEDIANIRKTNDDSGRIQGIKGSVVFTEESTVIVFRSDQTSLKYHGSIPGSLISHGDSFPAFTAYIEIPYPSRERVGDKEAQSLEHITTIVDLDTGNDNLIKLMFFAIRDLHITGISMPGKDAQFFGKASYDFSQHDSTSWKPFYGDHQTGALKVDFEKRGIITIKSIEDDPLTGYQLRWGSSRCLPPQSPLKMNEKFVFFASGFEAYLAERGSAKLTGLAVLRLVDSPLNLKSSKTLAQFASSGAMMYTFLPGVSTKNRFGETRGRWSDAVINRYLWYYYKIHGCYTKNMVKAALEAIGGFDLYMEEFEKVFDYEVSVFETDEGKAEIREKAYEPESCESMMGYLPWTRVHTIIQRVMGWKIERSSVGSFEASYWTEMDGASFKLADQEGVPVVDWGEVAVNMLPVGANGKRTIYFLHPVSEDTITKATCAEICQKHEKDCFAYGTFVNRVSRSCIYFFLNPKSLESHDRIDKIGLRPYNFEDGAEDIGRYVVKTAKTQIVLYGRPVCNLSKKIEQQCIPKMTSCLRSFSPEEKIKLIERYDCVVHHENGTGIALSESWDKCWQKRWLDGSCTVGEPLVHIDRVMQSVEETSKFRIHGAEPLSTVVYTRKHEVSPEGFAEYEPQAVYVRFRAWLGNNNGRAQLQKAVPPYMIVPQVKSYNYQKHDQMKAEYKKRQQRAEELLEFESKYFEKMKDVVKDTDCGATLGIELAKLGIKETPSYSALALRSPPVAEDIPVDVARRYLPMSKIVRETQGDLVALLLDGERNFVGDISLYLVDGDGSYPPVDLAFGISAVKRGTSRFWLVPGRHFITPPGCVPREMEAGKDEEIFRALPPVVMRCSGYHRINVELNRPAVTKRLVLYFSPVGDSNVKVFKLKASDPDMIYDSRYPRFHSSESWSPITDEKLALLNEAQKKDYIISIGPGHFQRNPKEFQIEGDINTMVRKYESSFERSNLVHGIFPGWLHAMAFGDQNAKVMVGMDTTKLKRRLSTEIGPKSALFGRKDAGFLRYMYKLTSQYLKAPNSFLGLDQQVLQKADPTYQPKKMRDGLYAGLCAGLCDVLDSYDIRIRNGLFRSLLPLEEPRRVVYKPLASGQVDSLGQELGLMHVVIRHIDVSFTKPEMTVEFGALFPENSKPQALGSGIVLDHLPEFLSGMKLSDVAKMESLGFKSSELKRSPSVLQRQIKAVAQRHERTIQRLNEVQSVGLELDRDGRHRQTTSLVDPVTPTSAYFRFQLAFDLMGEGDDSGAEVKWNPDKSMLLSLPVTRDRVIPAKTDDEKYFGVMERVDIRVLGTVKHYSSNVEESRADKVKLKSTIFFGGHPVEVDLGRLEIPQADSSEGELQLTFRCDMRATQETSNSVVHLEPPTSGILDVLRSLGFKQLADRIDGNVLFFPRGVDDHIKVITQALVKQGKMTKADKLSKWCRLALDEFFGEMASAPALQGRCKAADGLARKQMMRTTIDYVKGILADVTAWETLSLLVSEYSIPDPMTLRVSINSDGTVLFGLDNEDQHLTSLAAGRGGKDNMEPFLVGIELWKLMASSILGGEEGIDGNLMGVMPKVHTDFTVTLVPLLRTLGQAETNPTNSSIATEQSSHVARFETEYKLEEVILGADPSRPDQYCLLCMDSLAVETFNPYHSGLKLDLTNPCAKGVPAIQSSGLVNRKNVHLLNALINLPFLRGDSNTHEIPDSAQLDAILNTRLPCAEGKSASSAMAILVSLLSDSGFATRVPFAFGMMTGTGALLYTTPEMLFDTIRSVRDKGGIDMQELEHLGFSGISSLVQYLRFTEFESVLACPSKLITSQWETARVPANHPNSLSPKGYHRIFAQKLSLVAPRLMKLGDEYNPPDLTGLPAADRAAVISTTMEAVKDSLKATDDVTPVKVEDINTSMELALLSFNETLHTFEGMIHIGGFAAFTLADLVDSNLRGGFTVFGLSESRKVEFDIQGGLKYTFSANMHLDLVGRGSIRVADKMGPLAIRMINDELRVEMHFGEEDVSIFATFVKSEDGIYVDVRAGSAELQLKDEVAGYIHAQPEIASCFWGPGHRVTLSKLRWITKIITDDTYILPEVAESSKFETVRLHGSLTDVQEGKGVLEFYNMGYLCRTVKVEEWHKGGTWTRFTKDCNLADPKTRKSKSNEHDLKYRGCTDESVLAP